MIDYLGPLYPWLKWLHILAVISWMCALLYLPRLFVYHAETDSTEAKAVLEVMERKLTRGIMTPAMIVTWIAGLLLMLSADVQAETWMHIKILLVIAMTGFQGFCGKWRKELAAGTSKKSGRFFRMVNELPAVLMIFIVGLVVFKPF